MFRGTVPAPLGTGKVPSLGGEADTGSREEEDRGMPGHWHGCALHCRFQHEVIFTGSVFPLPKKMTGRMHSGSHI